MELRMSPLEFQIATHLTLQGTKSSEVGCLAVENLDRIC